MRFGILIDEIRFGGVEKVAIEQVRHLCRLGHDAVLLVLRRTESRAYSEMLVDVKKIYISDLLPKAFSFSFRFPPFRFFSLVHLSYALLIRFARPPSSFDVLIVHGSFACFSGVALARAKGIPLIAFIWDPVTHIFRTVYFRNQSTLSRVIRPFASAIARIVDEWICTSAQKVLTGSRYHLTYLQRLCGKSTKVRLVFPGVHVRNTPRAQRHQRVVLATAWKEGKNPQYVLRIARRVHMNFVLAGAWLDPRLKDSFLAQASVLGLEKSVEVLGPMTEAELLDLYSRCTVFLQVKADVGFGLPALEAAGQGCTFIIPKGQGVCDLFQSGRDGFIVDEEDTESIVSILQLLQDDPSLAVSMGRNAWRIASSFSWNKHAQSLCKLLQDLPNLSPHRKLDVVNDSAIS